MMKVRLDCTEWQANKLMSSACNVSESEPGHSFLRPQRGATRPLGAVSDTRKAPTEAELVRPLEEHLTNNRSGCVVVQLTH
jgi:hypothetical protein